MMASLLTAPWPSGIRRAAADAWSQSVDANAASVTPLSDRRSSCFRPGQSQPGAP